MLLSPKSWDLENCCSLVISGSAQKERRRESGSADLLGILLHLEFLPREMLFLPLGMFLYKVAAVTRCDGKLSNRESNKTPVLRVDSPFDPEVWIVSPQVVYPSLHIQNFVGREKVLK